VVAVLLQHGADSDEHYEGGLTPLMNAAKNGHLRASEILVPCVKFFPAPTTASSSARAGL